MEKANLYCNNCGNIGHLYKDCRHPILSYGIILYNKDVQDKIHIILIERKNSLSFIEFLRGKYSSVYNISYLTLLFSRFSRSELERIVKHDFDTLWKFLWIHTDTINHRIKKEYFKSKENFNKLKKGFLHNGVLININYLVNTIQPDHIYDSNEWEIPKGRRKRYENNKECAKREFQEETNIPPSAYNLYENIIPLIEEYKGINSVKYKHVYYIARIDELINIEIDMKNKDQYTEIKDIQWLTEKEVIEHIRDYNETKINVISKFFKFIKEHEKLVTIG